MLFRIYLVLIGLLCIFVIADTVEVAWAKSSARSVEEGYTLSSEEDTLLVVEYLDYACSYCQQLHPVLMRSLNRDQKVEYAPRPVPSGMGEVGTKAAILVYAAGRQGKFIEAHNEMIENYRDVDEAYISNFALKVGLDTEKLEADMQDPAIIEQLNDNMNTLKSLKVNTVPAILIGDRIMLRVNGELPSSDQLVSLFNQGRTL